MLFRSMPEAPFSIVDKVETLNSSGFKRILLDFSRTRVTRQELKAITNSMLKKQAVSETSRFNWKDGFYNPEKIEIYKAMNEKAEAAKAAGMRRSYASNGKVRSARGSKALEAGKKRRR